MNGYSPRIADRLLAEKLSYMGAILVRGAKWCGKTTTANQLAKSAVFLADARKGLANRQLAQQRPDRLLNGAYPRIVDEWQEVPSLWDAVRATVDEARERGMFILTGSAVPPQVDEEDGGEALIAKGVKSLKGVAAKLDTTKMPRPSFMMILTADGDFAYRTDEGILICPIGCLRGSAEKSIS